MDRKVVLIVDDDVTLREALADALHVSGYSTPCAANGIEAFDWMERHGAPDAVLLDLSMPEMNGWEFVEELREDGALNQVPLIVLTANVQANVPDVDAFLSKSASLERIVAALEEEIGAGP